VIRTVTARGVGDGPPAHEEITTFRAIERRDLVVGNVWEQDAQHHPHHMRQRLTNAGCIESRVQQAGADSSLLPQDIE
jgi:hypothetical protein